jgi:tetratricopeptide (TPR) repeat protein
MAGFAPLEKSTPLPLSSKGLLAILDYPESWREQVRALLREVARLVQPPAPIRLLLLSRRSFDEWWTDIVDCGANHLCTAQEVKIGPLYPNAAMALFHATVRPLEAYSRQRVPAVDDVVLQQWLARRPDLHPLPLLTTAAAIHFVLEPGTTLGLDGADIVSALVDRERKRIDGAGHSAGWVGRGASRLMGLAALREHGLDEAAITRLANPVLEIGFPPSGSVLEAARTLDGWRDDRLNPPQPDIVAAELLRQVLVDAGGRSGEWMWETLADKGVARPELFARRMHDMATLHGPAEDTLLATFDRAISGKPKRALSWRAFLDSPAGGFRLSRAGVIVGRTLLHQRDLSEEDRAAVLNNLSVQLGNTGDGAGALAASHEAVDIRRRLAQANPARFEPELASSLNNLSVHLSDTGDGAGALVAIRKAVDICRRLAQTNSARFEPELASSLNNLSNHLSDTGDGTGALAASREAAEIRRRLAHTNPARFEPDLASILNNLSNRLSDAGDGAGALAAVRRAAELYRRLAQTNPARFEPGLALSLNNLSNRLGDAGDGAGALAAVRRAAEIRRRLAETNPARFEPDLALSLNNLSLRLSDAGDGAGALAAIHEAAEIYRRLAQANPVHFATVLERTLFNLNLICNKHHGLA